MVRWGRGIALSDYVDVSVQLCPGSSLISKLRARSLFQCRWELSRLWDLQARRGETWLLAWHSEKCGSKLGAVAMMAMTRLDEVSSLKRYLEE